jgi:hypothetical protein
MKPLFAPALFATLFIISGCSEEKNESESGKKSHLLRQPIDTMNDARAVAETMNRAVKAQEEQAAEIAGH